MLLDMAASSDINKVLLRMPQGLRVLLDQARGNISLNKEIVSRLESSFPERDITLYTVLDEGDGLETRSVESFVEPVAVKLSPPSSVTPSFAFKPDPKANVKTVKQAVQSSGSCSAFCPRGTKCKVCGKVH